MLDSKMKDVCRICARELYGNQRRWIFHPTAKLSLQVLLSYALGREMTRDGRGEFACSKCAFMLDRMYRFDTVIARVEALSVERMQKLLLEKDRLRQCIGGLFRKNNADDFGVDSGAADSSVVDFSKVAESEYNALLQEDLTYSIYESWAEQGAQEQVQDHQCPVHHQCHVAADATSGPRPRKCKGCAALRVADSDYEAVCKVPRKVGRSTSCGPSTRYSGSVLDSAEETVPSAPPPEPEPVENNQTCRPSDPEPVCVSPASSVESLDTAVDVTQESMSAKVHPNTVQGESEEERSAIKRPGSVCGLDTALSLLKSFEYHPLQSHRGSRIPVLLKPNATPMESPYPLLLVPPIGIECPISPHLPDAPSSIQQELQFELAEMEDLWLDEYVQCKPLGLQKRLIEEQQCQLAEYENAAGQCVSELQKAQQQVQSLQTKIQESEASNKKLQQRLGDMESELRSLREAACGQERTIQTLSDSLNTKDCEITDLHRLIEEQKGLLRSLKQQNNYYQLQQQVSGVAPSRLQADMSDLQGSLFSAQLELQGLQRAQQQGQRREEDLARANQHLQADLQRALQQHQEGERHNQDLQAALEKVRLEVQQMEEKWRDEWRQREKEVEERERTIRELKTSLEHKERLIEDYSELVDGQKEPVGNRDNLIHKLKQRIQERDGALERAIDDKFTCMEQKEDEVHKLQLLLREKERDLEQLQCVLSNNEETIMSLELMLRGKSLELEQVCEAWRNAQGIQCEREESHIHSLRERDTLISQLQTSLHTRTEEAEEMTAVLLSKVSVGPGEVAEELKSRLQLKERLFQELLLDRSRQTQEHHSQVQDLLNTISAREQYIKDSAGRVGQVMAEQTARLQELRRQLGSANPQLTEADTQTLQDELRLTLRREREAQNQLTTLHATLASHQDQLKTQVSDIEALSRTVSIKEEIIKDLQMQLVDPSDLPLVERLTQELQMLREKVEHQDATCINHKQAVLDPLVSMETGQAAKSHADFGGCTSDDGEEDDEDCNSEFADSAEDEERSKLTAQSLVSVQSCDQHRGLRGCQDAVAEGPGLAEVKLLVEQKRAVERELMELKSQLEKAGFSSLSQMRKAFFTLRSENEELNIMVTGRKPQNDGQKSTSDRCDGQLVDAVGIEPNERQPMCDQMVQLKSDLEQVQQESRELQERLMVSEATVQAQAEQLKDYRELLTETSVQQDNKQVQVDIQDLGYETCGRSENEAEREETSSPEFDDLELCTSLTYRGGGSQWWGGSSSLNSGKTEHDVTYLQQLVEDLRGQLSQSQALVRSLQAQTHDHTPVSTPRKVNWGLDNSEAQSTAEEDEGWQSSDGFGSLPRQRKQDRELQELVSRVTSLEEQLRKGKGHSEDGKAVNWPGKFDTLIQAQARELSHLRQRMREGRGVCHILTQHLGDTTKTFEELLRSNDIDYYMGQSFRDQLSQSISLAQRVSTKISGRDHSEVPDDKSGHELLAIRLSKELQQKDKLIESLRSKLDQQQRSDTPTSSHALSVATDQSDGTSFVSDDHGSTNEDLELCSELDAASEYGQEEAARSATDSRDHRGSASLHPSNPPSITSSHSHQFSNTCPSMHCTPHRPMKAQAQTGLSTVPLSSSFSFSTALHCPQMSSPPVFDPQTQPLRTRHPYGGGFSLAEVHQELQMLQRQLGNSYHGPQIKALPAFALGSHTQPDHSSLHPLSHHAFEQSPFSSQHTSPTMKSGASLLESSTMWDMMYGPRSLRPGTYGDVSSGSSGYQSGQTGTDLMEEHLREIRTLRRRLEDSIQTNDRLRQQLEERLASSGRAGGAPTNIYIQGLDSVTQLSNEIRVLKEENHTLQTQLQQARTDGSKEMERLREVVLSGRGQLKQAELEANRWADQCRRLQSQVREQAQAVLQLKQEKQNSLDNSTRLQHEVNVLQQQLSECQCLVHTLQCELQVYQRVCGTTESNIGSGLSLTFDLRERESNIHLLEQQLRERMDQCMPRPSARKQLFHDQSPSPVRDTRFSSHASTAVETDEQKSSASDSSRSGAGALEAEAPDGSFACKTGRHMIGHVDDFSALQQQLLEGKVVIRKIEAALQSSTEAPNLPEGYMRNLHTSTKTLKQILEETSSLLRMFWRAALPSTEASAQQLKKEQPLRKEVVALRRKLSEQEQLLRDTMENLRTSSRTKDSMEQFIVNQLSRTQDVLKQARSNLEKNELKIASLGCTPLPSSFYSVSSTPSWSDRGEVSGAALQHASSLGWNFLTPHTQDQHKSMAASWPAQGSDRQRLLQVYCRTDSKLSAAVSPSF
ncbi:myomegalin-like isoform X6 [Sinocyclocheilus anshuiensis]|uniref:myomegalin-like isoform X6 n=1 Tax=Sinocyclocheilus anshuiensis TaxID=1608454 RepID=UPI0007B8C7A1|nr:PREDICTED: myomegalin-like isoform X6 [Sinocyclocheilus anshuiensis]